MLLIDALKDIPVVLGSQSPRRKELLAAMDISFEVDVRSVEEVVDSSLSPEDVAIGIARTKLSAFEDVDSWQKLVITADTIVVASDGQILGKPQGREDAIRMLSALSGQAHMVLTGVSLSYQGRVMSFAEATRVTFVELTTAEIDYYVDKYLPYDKAGAYGIQEWIGRVCIRSLDGSFENVMGLPTQRLYQELKQLFLK